MNGYQELREIHRLSQAAVVEFDKGEYPERAPIARIREIAGCFPKFENDNEYIGYARFRRREDNRQPYLSICDSDDEGAFPIYRHPKADAEATPTPAPTDARWLSPEKRTEINAARGFQACSPEYLWVAVHSLIAHAQLMDELIAAKDREIAELLDVIEAAKKEQP